MDWGIYYIFVNSEERVLQYLYPKSTLILY